jgi:hypothetical protein
VEAVRRGSLELTDIVYTSGSRIEGSQASSLVSRDPSVDGLPGHPVAHGNLGNRETVGEHLLHRLVALLHDPQLHQHDPDLLSGTASPGDQAGRRCQPSAGTLSRICRNHVTDQAGHRHA